MAQDPYGFPEIAGSPSAAPSDATRAMWLGVTSAILSATGICACYIPFFVGAPVGLYAAWLGMNAMKGAVDARDRAMATAGMVSGLVGGLVSAIFSFFILMYGLFIVLYFVVIILVVGFAAVNGQSV